MTKAQLGIRDAVSRHTRVKKNTVSKVMEAYLEEVGEDHPVVEIHLDNPSFSLRIGVSKNTIALGKMMFFKYLEKTELFSDVVALLRNEAAVVAFYSGGALLIIRDAHDYSGIGGIFVKEVKATTGGYVIEPIKHYLEDEYPLYFEE